MTNSWLLLFSFLIYWNFPILSGFANISLTDWIPTSWISRETRKASYEYTVSPQVSIELALIRGSIQIETWNSSKVMLTATIRAKTSTELAETGIKVEQSNKNHLIIAAQQPHAFSMIDTVLMVPTGAQVSVTISEQGAITVTAAPQHLALTTARNNIAVTMPTGTTLTAHAEQGSIAAFCEEFSTTSSLLLTAPNGSLTLQLPSHTQARIEARSSKGMIISSLPITFDSFTTVLDRATWKRLQKTVSGTINEGEAPITLSARGNITITTLET